VVLQRKEDTWFLHPEGYPADINKVKSVISSIEDLTLTARVSESGASYGRYDLDPDRKIHVRTLAGEDVKRELDIGKTAASYRHTFVKIGNDPAVYHARDDFRSRFETSADGFRDKTVLSFDPAGVVELTLEREGRGITLIPEPAGGDSGSVWKASDGRAVDAAGVNDLLATLSSLKCRSFIPDRKADDFRDPIYTVRLKGGISASLSIFPKEKPEDDGHPAVSSENRYPFILASDQAERIMKTPEEPVKSE
jgi:hypothetical protein